MTIRIKLVDGETVTTEQYTHAQAEALVTAGEPLQLGGQPDDFSDEDRLTPLRTVYPSGVASIEEVPT